MKLRNILNLVKNKTTNQYSYNIRKKQLQQFDISPENLLDLEFPVKKRRIKW